MEGGGFLLSRFRSTIGVTRFNFSVRNGKRWSPCAITALVYSLQLTNVAVPGLEPRLREPESRVLPLHHTAVLTYSKSFNSSVDYIFMKEVFG